MGTCFFLGRKRTGYGFDQPPLSSAEVNERVELYCVATHHQGLRGLFKGALYLSFYLYLVLMLPVLLALFWSLCDRLFSLQNGAVSVYLDGV
jgi:hypothetical protein